MDGIYWGQTPSWREIALEKNAGENKQANKQINKYSREKKKIDEKVKRRDGTGCTCLSNPVAAVYTQHFSAVDGAFPVLEVNGLHLQGPA